MDEVLRSDIHYQEHTGVLSNKLTQPTEQLILDRNAELRRNKGAIQDLGAQSGEGVFGRQVASIPLILFEKALQQGYQLNSKDSEFAGTETMRFLQSDLGKCCLVVEKL